MAIQHVDITDPNIHEPKGAAGASVNTVYVANGSGSGTWRKITDADVDQGNLQQFVQDSLDQGDIEFTGKFYMTGVITDVSAVSSRIIPLIEDCMVLGARFVLGGAITTANATIQVKNSAGATMGPDVTVAYTSSAKGDGYSFTATGNNVLVGPTWMEITSDGGSDTSQPLYFTIEFEYSPNAV